jgi:pimeloyl-ACP methyl ester carboxylesterase
LSLSSGDLAQGVACRIEWHDVAMGDYKARVCVRRWLPPTGAGPTLIAIHKVTGGGFDFDYLAARLAARGWQVICPDLPGHGRSTQFDQSEAYSTGNMSRALAALFRIYAHRNMAMSILGASWGGAAMLLFLAAYRLRVDALIVNDIAFEYDPHLERYQDRLREEWTRRFPSVEEAREQLLARNRELFQQHDAHRIEPDILQRNLDEHIVQTGTGEYRYNFDREFMQRSRLDSSAYPNFTQIMRAIQANRILLMFGAHSPFRNSATVQRLRSDDRRVEYVEISEAGHVPHLLNEHEFGIVREFLERGRPGRTAGTP